MAERFSAQMYPGGHNGAGQGIRSRLVQAAEWCDAELLGADAPFHGVSTDSRSLGAGALFVALRGPRFDGHDYAEQALKAGAAALMVERQLPLNVPQLLVTDTLLALGRLAAAWRQACASRLVAVTGSNGKTTVKEMIRAILAQGGPVLATEGNLNNDIGVPLTLLRLTPETGQAVVEMGANHPGEIAYLTELARPDVALITNAAAAHLEGFGSLEGVARAKGEIYQGLGETGTAVINADDPYAPLWRQLAGGRPVLDFGLEQPAAVSAEWRADGRGSHLRIRTPQGESELLLRLLGRHNVMNALAATAAALAAGADLEAVRLGLEGMAPVAGRLMPRAAIGGAHLIDDTYNANPASLRAGIEVLAACEGRRYLALGDMAELGGSAEALHAEAGEQARVAGIDRLYATGRLSRLSAESFGEGGSFYPEQQALIEALRPQLEADVTVLVKGSRSAHMERVVEALAAGGEG